MMRAFFRALFVLVPLMAAGQAFAQAVESALPPSLPPLPALPEMPSAPAAPAAPPSLEPVDLMLTKPVSPAEFKKPSTPAAPAAPAEPKTVQVPEMPVQPPGAPNPPPATPTFVKTEPPKEQGPSREGMEMLQQIIANPGQLPEKIAELPQKIGSVQDIEQSIRQVVSGRDNSNQFNGNNFEELLFRGSLMYPPAQLKQFYEAVKGRISTTPGAAAPVQVAVKTPRVAPAFYINSVLYEGAKNWTIWLNSRRIRYGAKFPELEITSVKADKVEFIWSTDSLDFISPDWEKKVKPVPVKPGDPVPDWAYISDDGTVFVDQSRRRVRFFIGPHQTFVSRKMQMVEGKVKSTFFQVAAPAGAAVPGAGAPGALPPPGTKPLGQGIGLSRQPASPQGVPVIPAGGGAIPGAAPGSPMGPPRTTLPAPTGTSLNPMALPPAMTTGQPAAPAAIPQPSIQPSIHPDTP